jgi:hypothetical protein
MTSKKIDLGEYVIKIYHNDKDGRLDVEVFDEGGEMIESIYITEDNDDEEEDDGQSIDFNLN